MRFSIVCCAAVCCTLSTLLHHALHHCTGIGGGLLQRCCFFGQHSHTLHSLLGLTDVKLKSELSALVDTSVWVNTLQDVKSREKKEKSRVLELSTEIRTREEEASRSRAAIDADVTALGVLEKEVEDAKLKGEINTSSSAFFIMLVCVIYCHVHTRYSLLCTSSFLFEFLSVLLSHIYLCFPFTILLSPFSNLFYYV